MALGVTAGAGAAAAGCGGSGTAARATSSHDLGLLNAALAMEHRLVATYAAAAGALSRDPGARATVQQLQRQEAEHVRGLGEAIKDLGGTPRGARAAAEYRASMDLGALTSAADVWKLSTHLENRAIAAYLKAVPALSSGELRQTVSAILANEAEHLAMIAGRRDPGRPGLQAPDAFVSGRPA